MSIAAVTTHPGTVRLEHRDPPPLGPDDALLRVEAVGICGTDLHIFDGTFPADLPVVQGHEISAVIERLPTDGTGDHLRVGSRVAVQPVVACEDCYPCRIGRTNTCRSMSAIGLHRPGGFQELVAVPVRNLHPAATLPPELAALCETLSVGRRSITRPGVTLDDSVLVLGAGPIGLSAVLAAHDIGARVMVLDVQPSRLDLARELGADETAQSLDEVVARSLEWTDGDGPSVVVEATGSARVAEVAFEAVATAGRISMVGVSEQRMEIGVRPFTAKELDVYGSRGTLDFPGAIDLARRHQDAVRRLISHRFPLDQVQEALGYAHDNPQDVVKTVIEVA